MRTGILELNGGRGGILESIFLERARERFGVLLMDFLRSVVSLKAFSTPTTDLPGPLGLEP